MKTGLRGRRRDMLQQFIEMKRSNLSIKEMSRLLTTFGMGSRTCIGQNIALVERYKFAAQFVRHFELESVNKDKPWTTQSSTFAFRSDFWIKLKTR